MRTEFAQMRADFPSECREIRRQIEQMKLLTVGGVVTIPATMIALHG